MDIEPPTTKWDNMCSGHQRPFLSACPDKPHLQERPIIGSPPPRGQAPDYWEGSEQYLNFRLEIPNLNVDQNAKCTTNQQNHNRNKSNEKRDEVPDLSTNVEGMHLQPIIVCDYADESNDQNNIVRLEAQGEEGLSVPAVDVKNEKKRPPMSDLDA